MPFNVCERCGEWTDASGADPIAAVFVCSRCGQRRPFRRLPLFVVTGASGSGKTAIAEALLGELDECVVLEHDLFYRREWFHSPETNFALFRRVWARLAAYVHQSGRSVVLFGTTLPEQNEPLLERAYFSNIHYLALVADDDELVRRLRDRPRWRDADDPAFVTTMREFNRWLKDNAATTSPPMTLLDTSSASVEASARAVAEWVRAQL